MSAIYAAQPTMRAETLAYWMAREGIILHPQRGYIPFVARDYQRDFWNDTSRLRIVAKARQIGFSQAVGAEAIKRAMDRPCLILIVSRNKDQAVQVLNYAKTIYNHLRTIPVLLTTSNQQTMEFANGSRILSLPASPTTGRGYPASHIYIDECAFVRWADIIYRAIAPAVATGGTITLLSSPDGTENLFGRVWEGGRNGRGPVRDYDGTPAPPGTWSRHHVPWDRNPEYNTDAWIKSNHPDHAQVHTPDAWASEFLASFLSSGDRVFRIEKLDEMIEGWVGLELTEGEAWDYPDPFVMEPVPGHLYMNAWDLGRKRDATVGITLDVTEEVHQLVCYERFMHMPWDEQQERITARYAFYPGWNAMDATGVGDPLQQHLEQQGYNIFPYVFSRISKPNAVNELKRSTEFNLVKLGIAQIYDEMQRYITKDENLVQDTVMALAIGEYMSRHLDLDEIREEYEPVDDVSRAFAGA